MKSWKKCKCWLPRQNSILSYVIWIFCQFYIWDHKEISAKIQRKMTEISDRKTGCCNFARDSFHARKYRWNHHKSFPPKHLIWNLYWSLSHDKTDHIRYHSGCNRSVVRNDRSRSIDGNQGNSCPRRSFREFSLFIFDYFIWFYSFIHMKFWTNKCGFWSGVFFCEISAKFLSEQVVDWKRRISIFDGKHHQNGRRSRRRGEIWLNFHRIFRRWIQKKSVWPTQTKAVHNSLGIIENLIEVRPDISELVTVRNSRFHPVSHVYITKNNSCRTYFDFKFLLKFRRKKQIFWTISWKECKNRFSMITNCTRASYFRFWFRNLQRTRENWLNWTESNHS